MTRYDTALAARPLSILSLSPARQRLVRLMQDLEFGQIERLRVVAGEPQLDPLPKVTRFTRFGEKRLGSDRPAGGDFVLKRQVEQLFAELDRMRDGVIGCLEVQAGLPFRMLMVLSKVTREVRP